MLSAQFQISYQAAEEFFTSLKECCRNTGTSRLPSFGCESSFLNSRTKGLHTQSWILAIDVGGTRTKVCARRSTAGSEKWAEILDLENNQLANYDEGPGLSRMTRELGKQISTNCLIKDIPLAFDGIAVVWSNKLKCFPLKGAVRGVGATVYGSASGEAYRKGEWWNSDISDGDSISAAFIEGLGLANIQSPVLVVGNDTIFTAKALIDSDAGVVASTGANTTIIPIGDSTFYNSECGGLIEVSNHFLGLSNTKRSDAFKLEDLCAGKGISRVFSAYIEEAVALGASELSTINQILLKEPLNAKEFAEIAAGNCEQTFAFRSDQSFEPATWKSLLDIAAQTVHNAGVMCGVLMLVSVANQLDSKDHFLIALDSSQARFVPGYLTAMEEFLNAWSEKNRKKIAYSLLWPAGSISVPLRGAANSVDEFR